MRCTLAAIAALSLAVGTADAARFAPYNTAFTITGSMQMHQVDFNNGQYFNCPFTFSGMTGGKSSGGSSMTITGASFCSSAAPVQLPWDAQAVSRKGRNGFVTMALNINGSYCGSQVLIFQLKHGTVYWGANSFPNGCDINGGNGTITPLIKILN